MVQKETYAIGVDLGGTNLKLGLVSRSGKIVDRITLPTEAEKGPKHIIKSIKKGIKELKQRNDKKLIGVGIGAPGVISLKKGTVENPPNFPGWGKVHLGKLLEKSTGMKIIVENDANTAAIGEMIFGNGQKFNSFIMITLGTGVGGGIILNKKLFRGDTGAAGEIGHISIDYKGHPCNCGSIGCIETYCGNSYLIKRVESELQEFSDSIINKLLSEPGKVLSPKLISEALRQKDKFAEMIINRMGEELGAALASSANLLDVCTFIIGGGVSGFGKQLFNSVESTLRKRVLKSLTSRVKVVPAKLKNESGIKGAAALVFYKIE